MEEISAARLLVDCLVAQGASHIFGVPGESYLSILDALYDTPSIRYVNARQEGGAAMMAEAQAKLTGSVGLCMVTRGPGATNASAGLHVAFQDSTPMVLFIGQVARDQLEREAFQEIDYRRMFGQMAKWVAQIDDPDRIPEYIARAYRTALSGRPGPVVLALPEDMLTEKIRAPEMLPAQARPADNAPSPAALSELKDLLVKAQRPFLIIGGGGWSPDARDAIATFAEQNGIPVGCSFRCQDYFPNNHPNYAGHVGIGIDATLAKYIKQSDCLIVLGARLGEMTTSGYSLIDCPIPTQPLIHIHADPEELGRVFEPALAIASNHISAAAALADSGTIRKKRNREWVTMANRNYKDFSTPVANNTPGAVQMAAIMQEIDRQSPDDVIYTNGAGNYAIWVHRFLRYKSFRSQLAPTSGSMGYGLPAAIAASLTSPARPVICFTGDGCFQMTSQELATAIQERVNIKILIVNNGLYGTIRMHQERRYPARVSGTNLVNPDFVALAKAMGGWAERVEKTEEFAASFSRLMAHDGPGLIEIITDPEALTPAQSLSDIRHKH